MPGVAHHPLLPLQGKRRPNPLCVATVALCPSQRLWELGSLIPSSDPAPPAAGLAGAPQSRWPTIGTLDVLGKMPEWRAEERFRWKGEEWGKAAWPES